MPQFYQDSWLNLVDAIASLIDEDTEFVFDALDGKTNGEMNGQSAASKNSNINYREEPVAFFFVLFGLAFEALAGRSTAETAAARAQKLEILLALKKILRPSISGNAIYQEVIFNETMDLLDRMVLTEPPNVQTVIVEIARNLCVGHPSSRQGMRYALSKPVVGYSANIPSARTTTFPTTLINSSSSPALLYSFSPASFLD